MENTNTNTKGLSPQEQYILDNKEKYISLQENQSETLDITNELLSLTEKFSLGQMIHTEDFTLEETMNSVELDHFKMDAHFNYKEAGTFRKLFKLGKVKKMSDLSDKETLSLIDNLLIREIMWLNGAPIYQSIFNLVYFTEDSINQIKSDENLFRIYLDSTLHITYLTFVNVVECSCLREEDLMMIPIQNADVLKREKVYDELKWAENELMQKLKILEGEDKKIISSLLNRFRMRRDMLSIIKEQFDFENKNRYENLIVLVNSLRDLFNEFKSTTTVLTLYDDNLKLTNDYFSEKICRVAPCIASIKQLKEMNINEAILLFEKFIENLSSISKIYDINDFHQILKSIEILNNTSDTYKPSFLIRAILELNLFPSGCNKLFEKIDYPLTLHKNLQDYKINFLEGSSDLISNLVSVNKEMLIKNLKNKARRVRDSNLLFEGLAFLVLEANHQEKEINKNKKGAQVKRSVLTNLLLWQCLHQMNQHVWLCFELELFAGFELDFVFYTAQTIIEILCQNTNIIANSFAEKILREEDFVKSNSKKKLNSTQRMILDEIHILNGLRCALKGMTLMCRYLKMSGMINNPQSLETEKLRVLNRFPFFNHCRFFIDFSYESFTRDMYFELPKEKDMILQSADSYLKQSIKYLNELKAADLKLRDGLHYSNSYIENLSKAIICNNLVLSKIRKLEKKGMRLSYTLKKYDTFLPILELN
jgi:hypothetical protein